MRTAVRLVALALLVILLPGCGPFGDDGPPPPPLPEVSVPAADAAGEGRLRVIAAAGVAPPAVVDAFERSTGCAVDLVVASDRRAVATIAGGGAFDAAAVPGADVLALAGDGHLQALPTALAASGGLARPFRGASFARAGDRLYAVPYLWQPAVLVYPAGTHAAPPTTVLDLYAIVPGEPRVAMLDDPRSLGVAALALGADQPFRLEGSVLEDAVRLARLQAPLVAARLEDERNLARLYRPGSTPVVALVPRAVAEGLRRRGLPVAWSLPRGPTLGHAYAWVVPTGAPHPVCAARWLAHTLEPGMQAAAAGTTGLAPVVPAACELLGPARCDADGMGSEGYLGAVRFVQTPLEPTGRGAWEDAWRRATGRPTDGPDDG